MGIKLQLSLAVLFFAQIANTADVCRAIALSGGGSIGSYEAAAIYGLNNFGNPADYAWDSITGISAGSINAVGISFFAPEDGLAMSDWLVNTWRTISN
jgi:predicted acylesterase/phospholipase RssA